MVSLIPAPGTEFFGHDPNHRRWYHLIMPPQQLCPRLLWSCFQQAERPLQREQSSCREEHHKRPFYCNVAGTAVYAGLWYGILLGLLKPSLNSGPNCLQHHH